MEKEINVLTLNVRFDVYADKPVEIPHTGPVPPSYPKKPWIELPWAERRSRLVDCILGYGHLDLIGFQEVLIGQLNDLRDLLGSSYSHVGVGRENGKKGGEHSPIFWDNSIWDKLDFKTIWLSETPEKVGSVGWDADLTRIATFLSLKHRKTGQLLHAINTHYDHAGVKARAESSLLIRSTAYTWVKDVEKRFGSSVEGPLILFGDFNSPPHEMGYKNMTSASQLDLPSYYFLDSYTNLKTRNSSVTPSNINPYPLQTAPYGPNYTYSSFDPPFNKNPDQKRIDFILLGKEVKKDDKGDKDDMGAGGGWKAVRYNCIDNFFESVDGNGWIGRWSDHRAVKVTFRLL